MKKSFNILIVIILCFCGSVNSVSACSAFSLKKNNQSVFGKNFDWFRGNYYIFTNQRGLIKQGIAYRWESETAEPTEWTSLFGSVTFNLL